MKAFSPIFSRELSGFARSPVSYLIAALVVLVAGVLAFPPGVESGGVLRQASGYLRAWPWLMAGLGAAFGARLWAPELRSGSLLRILSEPTPLWHVACAKIAAAWLAALYVAGLALSPAISAVVLGRLDGGLVFSSAISAALLLGAFTALGAAASAVTRDETSAFVLALGVALGLVALTDPPAGAPAWIEGLGVFSPAIGFAAARHGVLELAGLVQSLVLLLVGGVFSIIALEARRAG